MGLGAGGWGGCWRCGSHHCEECPAQVRSPEGVSLVGRAEWSGAARSRGGGHILGAQWKLGRWRGRLQALLSRGKSQVVSEQEVFLFCELLIMEYGNS